MHTEPLDEFTDNTEGFHVIGERCGWKREDIDLTKLKLTGDEHGIATLQINGTGYFYEDPEIAQEDLEAIMFGADPVKLRGCSNGAAYNALVAQRKALVQA